MCPTSLPALRPLPHIVIPGTPRRQRSGASLPARNEAAGARAAWSQPSPSPPERARCSGDAGPPKADQKAGDEGSETETVSESESESEAVSVAGTGTAVPAWSLRGVLEATDSLWIGQRDRHPPAVVGSHQGNRCHAGREGSQPLRRRPSHRLAHNAVPGSPGRRAPGQLSRLRSRPPGIRNPRPPPWPKPPSPNLERPPARGALIAEAIVVPPGPLGGLA